MPRLNRLPVLLFDCQATGSNPERDSLLEIGWARFRAVQSSPPEAACRLVKPGPETIVPKHVRRVTGIDEEALSEGCEIGEIWNDLATSIQAVAARRRGSPCPAVIHFARFEEPFLRWIQRSCGCSFPQPVQILCTHEIAKRLLPDLPRRGLRAVAGYFGHTVPELRRSVHHVRATAAIWKALVELLQQRGVDSLEGLVGWLRNTEASPRCGREFPMQRRRRLSLPCEPGVYRIRRVNGDILYVGKATSLKHRVNSHFQKRAPQSERALEMLAQAQEIDFTVTHSALEAALLESDEIKRLSPPTTFCCAWMAGSWPSAIHDFGTSRRSPEQVRRRVRSPAKKMR